MIEARQNQITEEAISDWASTVRVALRGRNRQELELLRYIVRDSGKGGGDLKEKKSSGLWICDSSPRLLLASAVGQLRLNNGIAVYVVQLYHRIIYSRIPRFSCNSQAAGLDCLCSAHANTASFPACSIPDSLSPSFSPGRKFVSWTKNSQLPLAMPLQTDNKHALISYN